MGCGCGCVGELATMCGATQRAALMGDVHALKLMAETPAPSTMGGLLPEVVFPANVTAYIAKLDPSFVSTNATVLGCAALPAAQKDAWAAFNTEWRKLADQGVRLFSSWEAQLDLVKRYESELEDWQEKIGAVCALSTPIVHSNPSSGFPVVPVVLVGLGAAVVGALGYSFYRAGKQASKRAGQGRALLEGAVDRQISSRFGETPPAARRAAPARRSKSTALARVK